MSQDVAFRRKVIYIAAIAALLYPLFRIGQPASRSSQGEANPGGVLAQLRSQYNLSQAELGEIDPTGESLKLATLGMRGVAANLLWTKANTYKMKEDWDNFGATLNQITKLQPNFIAVWEFQAHNLSYNISVEFDDYRQRYHWVKKGISFLMGGTHYNRDNPRLLHTLGWYNGQKFGRADEHVQFRQLFREDDEFHSEINANGVTVDDGAGYDGRPDNWLVGQLWYKHAIDAVDKKGMPLKSKSPLIFRADYPMSQINYASDIEDEGILGQYARRAWTKGGEQWAKYGTESLPTSWGHNIRLGDHPQIKAEIERLRAKFDKLTGLVRETLLQEKIAKLTPEQQAVLKLAESELNETNYPIYRTAKEKTPVTHAEVAQRTPAEVRDQAAKLAAKLDEQETLAMRTASYRGTINYEYWETRCNAEQTETAVSAREFLYKAEKARNKADLETARQMYEASFKLWKALFDNPNYERMQDNIEASDLVEAIQRYQRMLQQLDEELPENFVLRGLLERRHEDLSKYFKKKGGSKPGEKPASAEKPTEQAESVVKPVRAEKPAEKPEPAEKSNPTETPQKA